MLERDNQDKLQLETADSLRTEYVRKLYQNLKILHRQNAAPEVITGYVNSIDLKYTPRAAKLIAQLYLTNLNSDSETGIALRKACIRKFVAINTEFSLKVLGKALTSETQSSLRLLIVDALRTSCRLLSPILPSIFKDLERKPSDISKEVISLLDYMLYPENRTTPNIKSFDEPLVKKHLLSFIFRTGDKTVIHDCLDLLVKIDLAWTINALDEALSSRKENLRFVAINSLTYLTKLGKANFTKILKNLLATSEITQKAQIVASLSQIEDFSDEVSFTAYLLENWLPKQKNQSKASQKAAKALAKLIHADDLQGVANELGKHIHDLNPYLQDEVLKFLIRTGKNSLFVLERSAKLLSENIKPDTKASLVEYYGHFGSHCIYDPLLELFESEESFEFPDRNLKLKLETALKNIKIRLLGSNPEEESH
ncbi:MAG: hypothetical protein R3A13_05945 [Bdellovibrionota bacterium]